MKKKKPATNNNQQQAQNPNTNTDNQADYIDPCTEGDDCFEGDQRTFLTPFEISQLRIPADRLSIWLAQELVTNPSGANQDWWTELCGSKEVRPVVKSLRDRGWPILDVWEHSPTPRLPMRHTKTWYLTPEHRLVIARLMHESGLMGSEK